MIQDINFWIQFFCGIIVGRGVIAETEVGKKFLHFVSKAKFMLIDTKINPIAGALIGLFLFFISEVPFVVLVCCFFIWLNIPIFLQQHKKGFSTSKILWLKFTTWFALGIVVLYRAESTKSYPFSLVSILTSSKSCIFLFGFIGIVLVGVLCDYVLLKISIKMHKFITTDRILIFATIMFFIVCPIVEYSKCNTFQDIIKSIEAKKESFLNRLPSLSNQQQESQIKEKTT